MLYPASLPPFSPFSFHAAQVLYAFEAYPQCSLYNGKGGPDNHTGIAAPPFRTPPPPPANRTLVFRQTWPNVFTPQEVRGSAGQEDEREHAGRLRLRLSHHLDPCIDTQSGLSTGTTTRRKCTASSTTWRTTAQSRCAGLGGVPPPSHPLCTRLRRVTLHSFLGSPMPQNELEFKLVWPMAHGYQHWKQSSNPVTSPGKVTGYMVLSLGSGFFLVNRFSLCPLPPTLFPNPAPFPLRSPADQRVKHRQRLGRPGRRQRECPSGWQLGKRR